MAYKSKNMHYAFNKEYFDRILTGDDVNRANEDLYRFEISSANTYLKVLTDSVKEMEGYCDFSLYTTYPGLLIGSGYPHNSGTKESIVGGAFFDYINGLPILPGSSLKGILRSYFPMHCRRKDKKGEYSRLIRELLDETEDFNVEVFEEELFDNSSIFLGAIPEIKERQKVFESEYITPHKSPTKGPVALAMLKVAPGVKYHFIFIIKKVCLGDKTISAERIAGLFKDLLLIGGVGAKTSVGFGRFCEEDMGEAKTLRTFVNYDTKAGSGNSGNFGKGKDNSEKAPLCDECKKNPVTWNPKIQKWNRKCSRCFNRERGK